MGEFSAEWLSLREPADARARATALVEDLRAHLPAGRASAPDGQPLRILDLGTGTGANVRALAPQLPMPQHWCLVDRDGDLLRDLTKRVAAWALDRGAIVNGAGASVVLRGPACDMTCDTMAIDLARIVEATESLSRIALLFAGSSLVTASALLDLVSARWLDALVGLCAGSRACALFVLTYDGRLSCTPSDPDDEWVRTLVNQHQRTAKGFGRALGPDATAHAARAFTAAGYHVSCAPSDWQLTPRENALQRPLIDGWAAAAADLAGTAHARVHAWHERRMAHLEAGTSHVTVGHQDLAAWPRPSDDTR